MNRPIFPRAIIIYLWLHRQPSLLIVRKPLCIMHLIMILAWIHELSQVQRAHSARYLLLFEWVLFCKFFAVPGICKADCICKRYRVLATNIRHWRYQSFFHLDNAVLAREWILGRKHNPVSVYWLISVALRSESHCGMGIILIFMILNADHILIDREDAIFNNIHVVITAPWTSMISVHKAIFPILWSSMLWTRTLFLYDFKLYVDIFVTSPSWTPARVSYLPTAWSNSGTGRSLYLSL